MPEYWSRIEGAYKTKFKSEVDQFPQDTQRTLKRANKTGHWLSVMPSHVDGEPYYKYMLIDVDDVLHIAENPEEDMVKLGQAYRLKDSVGPPDRYLGGNIEKVQTDDGSVAWSLSCYDYLNNTVKQVQDEKNLSLKQFGTGLRPYPSNYRPEVDVTQVLDEHKTNRFQQLMVILRWPIELGRVDILMEVSCLSQHLVEPREGHLIAVYKIFKYLNQRLKISRGRMYSMVSLWL